MGICVTDLALCYFFLSSKAYFLYLDINWCGIHPNPLPDREQPCWRSLSTILPFYLEWRHCFKFLSVEKRIPKLITSKRRIPHLFRNMATITMPGITPLKLASLTSSTSLLFHHIIKLIYTCSNINYFFIYFSLLQTN